MLMTIERWRPLLRITGITLFVLFVLQIAVMQFESTKPYALTGTVAGVFAFVTIGYGIFYSYLTSFTGARKRKVTAMVREFLANSPEWTPVTLDETGTYDFIDKFTISLIPPFEYHSYMPYGMDRGHMIHIPKYPGDKPYVNTSTSYSNQKLWRWVDDIHVTQVRGREVLTFHNVLQNGNLPHTKWGLQDAGVIAVQTHPEIPGIHIAPRNGLWKEEVKEPGIPFGHTAFNEYWKITAHDDYRTYLHDVLPNTSLNILMDSWREQLGHIVFHNGYILSILPGQLHTPESYQSRIEALTQLAENTHYQN